MEDSFFAYLQQLEAMAFFSGYPLLYMVIFFFGRDQPLKNNFRARVFSLLPLAYAAVGTLYLGLQLKNLYPHYSIENLRLSIQEAYLVSWALLALLFWIPALRKRPALSLFHSLIFFFFVARDLLTQIFQRGTDKNIVKNDMKIYTVSLLLNLGVLMLLIAISLLITWVRRQNHSPRISRTENFTD